MLHLLAFAGDPTAHPVLRAMFAARKSVFVDLLGWNVPVVDGTYEIDQFDDAHARYLVLVDNGGRHLGSARLLPTIRPHILGTLYPQLCDDAPPSLPDILEITRFCLDRSLGARERRAVRDALVTALAHHAIEAGIRRYSAIAELGWFQQILGFGWRCRPLGAPRIVGGRTLAALAIDIDAATPGLLADAGIAPGAQPWPAGERAAA